LRWTYDVAASVESNGRYLQIRSSAPTIAVSWNLVSGNELFSIRLFGPD